MNNKIPHTLAVKKPLSRLYMALFYAPLLTVGPADIARADDIVYEGDARIQESLAYTGSVYVGSRNENGNVLIDNGKITAYGFGLGDSYEGKIHEGTITVRGPNAELNAVKSESALRSVIRISHGALRIEDGAKATTDNIEITNNSSTVATGAGSRLASKSISVGGGLGDRASLLIEDGAVVDIADYANIGAGSTPLETDRLSPKVTVTGGNSQWNVANNLLIAGNLEVLNGGAVNAGSLQVQANGAANRTAGLVVAGKGSRVTTDSTVNIAQSGNGSLVVMDGGTFSAGDNELLLGIDSWLSSGEGTLIIGSRGDMINKTDGEPTLGEAGGAGNIDTRTAISLGGRTKGSVYFNHTDDNYVFGNKITGQGRVINTAGQTTLNGDLTQLKADIIANGGKLILNSDIDTVKGGSSLLFTLSVQNGATLIVNGTAGYDVDRSIESGILAAGSATVWSGGTLGGSGTLGPTFILPGGHISPGDGNIGTLTVRRSLEWAGESFYDVDIAGDGRSDLLQVAGKTTISDQAKVQVTALDPQTSYQTGQSYRILNSDGGIDGQFAAAISRSAFLDVALNQSANAVDLTIAQKDSGGGDPGDGSPGDGSPGDGSPGDGSPGDGSPGDGNPGDGSPGDGSPGDGSPGDGSPGDGSPGDGSPGAGNPGSGEPGIFQTVALSRNQWNTAGALSTLTQSGPSLGLYNSLLLMSAPEAREAFNQLSGEVYPSLQSTLISDSTQLVNVLNQRMLRLFDNDSLPIPPLAMSLVQSAPVQNSGVWGQTYGSWGKSSGNGNVGKLDGNTTGFILGGDRKLPDYNVRLGGYFGYSRGDYDVDSRRSSADIDNYHLGLYAAGQQDAFSLRGALGYTWHNIDGKRHVNFNGFSDRLKSDYDANSLLAYTEAGYRFGQPGKNVEPFINLSYVRLHTDSFRESGGAAALSVGNETMNTFFSTLGMRGVTELPKNVSLYGSLGWQHAYGDKNTSSRMAFAGSDAFVSHGQNMDDDVMVGDVGVSVKLSHTAALDVGYQGQFGADTRLNSVNANLRWSF